MMCLFLERPCDLRIFVGVIPAADIVSYTRGVDPAADSGSDPRLARKSNFLRSLTFVGVL